MYSEFYHEFVNEWPWWIIKWFEQKIMTFMVCWLEVRKNDQHWVTTCISICSVLVSFCSLLFYVPLDNSQVHTCISTSFSYLENNQFFSSPYHCTCVLIEFVKWIALHIIMSLSEKYRNQMQRSSHPSFSWLICDHVLFQRLQKILQVISPIFVQI